MTKKDIDNILNLDSKYHGVLDRYGINTPLRKANFWGQLQHESQCKPVQENLNYSPEGLSKTFPKYFPTVVLANTYAHNKVAIANRVYGNRMGNGDERSGDGWKYSGKGMIQITGKDNYKSLSADTGIDFLNHPELLLEEVNALISALWYFKKHNLNALADKGDVVGITKAINGGTIGLEERKANVEALKQIFK